MTNKRPFAITALCAFQASYTGLFMLVLLFPQNLEFIWNFWMKISGVDPSTASIALISQGKWFVFIGMLLPIFLIHSLWNMRRWAFIVYLISATYGFAFVAITAFYGKPINFFTIFWNILLLVILPLNFKHSIKRNRKQSA